MLSHIIFILLVIIKNDQIKSMFEAMNQMLNHLNYYFLIIHYYKFIRKTWFQMANFIKTICKKEINVAA